MKKAQNMSLSTIVVAALVVLVLIVLSVIFIRSSGGFVKDVHSCESQGGMCAEKCKDAAYGTQDYTIPKPSASCDDGKTCCLKIGFN